MSGRRRGEPRAAVDLLRFLAAGSAACRPDRQDRVALAAAHGSRRVPFGQLAALIAADLILVDQGRVSLTEAGTAYLARATAPVEPFLAQHASIVRRTRSKDDPIEATLENASESPLAWLARRKDRNGRPLIDLSQLAAGERLRADFTRAGLTPRVTAKWIAPVAHSRRTASGAAAFSDAVLAAKQRVAHALDAVGPEFAGLLLDVCCFLKGLETVERERRWPSRAAKVVLGLALDRLARHYGIEVEAVGPTRARVRAWQADGARPAIDPD